VRFAIDGGGDNESVNPPIGLFSRLWSAALVCTALAGVLNHLYGAAALLLCGAAFLFGYGRWLDKSDKAHSPSSR